MTAITINISDDQLQKLKQLAQESGVSPEELLRASIEAWLSNPVDEFARAASYVSKKNSELYQRLA